MIIRVEQDTRRREVLYVNDVEGFVIEFRQRFPKYEDVSEGALTGVWGQLVNRGEGQIEEGLTFKVLH